MNLRRTTIERPRGNKNYNLYCINFHGTGLNSIKDEFKRQIQTGLRRSVFVLDLQEVQQEVNNQQHNDYMSKRNDNLTGFVIEAIHNFRKEYDLISKKINDELKFDLYQYWLKDVEDKQKSSMVDTVSLKDRTSLNIPLTGKSSIKRQSKLAKSTKARKKSMVAMNSPGEQAGETEGVACVNTFVKEHNRVGQPEMLSKRKYIKDDPVDGKLHIIIIGHMEEQFYLDLLRRDQPVLGVVHFLPAESNYDILLSNNKLRSFIVKTLESLNASFHELRQAESTKAVGLFTYDLPIISTCLASKHQGDIYDQLTWGVYDIELLQEQYQAYYYRPFEETDVAIPASVDLQQLYTVAESLCVQGHFQKSPHPGSSSDMATIISYFDSLLNTWGLPGSLSNDKEVELLSKADQSSAIIHNDIEKLIKSQSSAFGSITKIKKCQRLFVEDTNKLLNNMLLYVDQDRMRDIYLTCLDYNLWRQYVQAPNVKKSRIGTTTEPLSLPGYIKFYTNEDCCEQKISELLSSYDDYHIDEIETGCKLYTFRKTYNTVIEDERMVVIPTRLCFRDFVLFQRQEFLENLVTQEMRRASKEEAKRASLAQDELEEEMKIIDLNEHIFIRPNSLKALKLLSEKENEHSQSQRDKEVRSSRNKKPSIKRISKLSQEWVGLPPDHHLIKGYNLEDIRQEIRCKTSKYLFEHGCIKLYQEKWCFQDMNQELILTLNDCHMFFCRPRHQTGGISNNIRLQVKDNVNIRILNEARECAKVVMNYANGLSLYYHDMDCEQIWCSDGTFQDEQRRICTPYGAVIVFYKMEHMVLVMRYNGEVYKMYQYELAGEEEEQDMLSEFSGNQFSEFNDTRAQGDVGKENIHGKPGRGTYNESPHDPLQRTSDECLKIKSSFSSTSSADRLRASINDELKFLHYISAAYGLSYRHLVVTTSQGRQFNLMPNGKTFAGKPCTLQEWHDYYANESYCARSDGVKMIWTRDSLKCYHRDGTVLTSRTEEIFEQVAVDEFESQISQSSSHGPREGKCEECLYSPMGESNLFVNNCPVSPQVLHPNYSDYLTAEGADEVIDDRYVCYSCPSCLMQHHHYAGVYILWLKQSLPTKPSVLMEISGIDDIFIYTKADDRSESLNRKSTTSEVKKDHVERVKLLVNVWIGNNLHLTVDEEGCEIYVGKERHTKEDANHISDSLTLRLQYKDCLPYVFKYLVNEIATFQDDNGPKTQELYYVERIGKDSQVKGFEFLNCLPKLTGYSCTSSNCTIVVQPLKTINELMTHNYEWFEKDMKKFPKKTEKSFLPEPEFPKVCITSIYFKVPSLLQNTKDVGTFLEPFADIHFKKLRRKLKQLLDIYLRPQLQQDVNRRYSSNNWVKRHREHEKRKLVERQRMGLYHAMLKHRMYPNYFIFKHKYDSSVRCVDFFDFMKSKCETNVVKREEVCWNLQNKL